MSKYLKSYFTDTEKLKIFIDSENSPYGALAIYIPRAGNLTIVSENYFSSTMKNDFFDYYLSVFGKPKIKFLKKVQLNPIDGALVMTHQYTPIAAKLAKKFLGSNIEDVYDKLENKYQFQKIVLSVLGPNYSTNPEFIPAKEKIDTLYGIAGHLFEKKGCVLKIPQGYNLGNGVEFITSRHEINHFLKRVNGVNDARLTKDIMIEKYFDHDFSPSISFFASPEAVTPLTINYQILNAGKFIAATNIIPKRYEGFTYNLLKRGMKLASCIHKIGGRGLFGIDIVLNSATGKEKYVECNYRGTGTTNPELTYQKATNFTYGIGSGNWVFIPYIKFDPFSSPDLSAAIENLRRQKLLFEGAKTDINTPKAVILHGMISDGYFLSYFWNRGNIPSSEAFTLINKSLQQLGCNKKLPI
ncbi:MAG: hypothetical protein Q7K55_06955 [Candidatus Levybacteria bacterium]|nr:hypothetical protein [Candidatus Levybacteria bacterium]